MRLCLQRVLVHSRQGLMRGFSTTSGRLDHEHYRVVVAGGGAGGCAVAARACRQFGPGKVAIIEPAKYHYYQPLWTLVGAGIKPLEQTRRTMKDVLPPKCDHISQTVVGFEPDKNRVALGNGETVTYDFLVIALGIKLDFDKVEGLPDALKEDPTVCSNYDYRWVGKTFPAIQKFKGGTALFTFPASPIKCPGAPQKIMYMADAYWRTHGVRDKTKIFYHTSLPVIFLAPKYAESLMKIVHKRDMKVNFRRNLRSIDPSTKTATFELLDSKTGETESSKYDFIHVTPPQSSPDAVRNSSVSLTDGTGFLDVNKHTLQHVHFHNIFGIGDCINLPNPRTAAAVAGQNKILFDGLLEAMDGKEPTGNYQGYTACPLVTGYKKCIMAEFDYTFEPVETFPFNQRKERRSMYHVNVEILPRLYWDQLLKGNWGGPKFYRTLFHLGFK